MRFLPPKGLDNPCEIIKQYTMDSGECKTGDYLLIEGRAINNEFKWSCSYVSLGKKGCGGGETFLVAGKNKSHWVRNDGDLFDSETELTQALMCCV